MISERLAEAMRLRGFGVTELADKADMNHSRVSDILSKKTKNPRIETMAKLAIALDVSVEWLYGKGEDIVSHKPNEAKIKGSEPDTVATLALKNLFDKLEKLSYSDQLRWLAQAEESIQEYLKKEGK